MQSVNTVLSFADVALREISSTAALMNLLLAIEIHVAVCRLQATHRSAIEGLLLQSWLIEVLSLLGGVWNSGAAPADVHRGAAIHFWKHSIQNQVSSEPSSANSKHALEKVTRPAPTSTLRQ